MTDEIIPVRLSHLLSDCSVGAIVRGPNCLMVVQDTSTWSRSRTNPQSEEIRYVERVKSALKIEKSLFTPPRSVKRNENVYGWIPALRFPTWMRCLHCYLLFSAPWRRSDSSPSNYSLTDESRIKPTERCTVCQGTLEQVPWVLVHQDGHLADVPWHSVAHKNKCHPKQELCPINWSTPYLKLEETDGTQIIRCERCGANSTLKSRMLYPPWLPAQPWMTENMESSQANENLALLVDINDVRVHSPSIRTALVIPPESRICRGTIIDRLYSNEKKLEFIQKKKNPLARKTAIRHLAREFSCDPEEIRKAINKIDQGYPSFDQDFGETDLPVDEYRALIQEIPNLHENEDFVTEHHTRDWKALQPRPSAKTARRTIGAVSNLIAVNRLKEIMVFFGFRRAGGERNTPPDITGKSGWLPALELYGEGIFFTLDEKILKRWEQLEAVQQRTEDFAERYRKREGQGTMDLEVDVTPRFLLCHTLAHLMIRELDAGAGYPAASLKERIYTGTGKTPMAGILIYVAVPDEEGSLGGLMELAKPNEFLRLLTKTFESATWCSLDPVCSEQDGHGPDLLNRAACHACALVPETSCEHGNVLLDRVFVTGTDQGVPAFLDCVE